MKVLLLVDLQNDFMPGGALAVNEGDEVVAIANELMASSNYDYVVATQDWHPVDHGSFADNHEGRNVFDMVDLNGLDQILWPVHCVQDTKGAEFNKDLNIDGIDHIFPKGTDPTVDSYSGFFDNGKRNQTELVGFLNQLSIDEIDVMGLATDYCVKFTALDSVACGYKTRLLLSGCRAVNMNAGDDHKALIEMVYAGIDIIT